MKFILVALFLTIAGVSAQIHTKLHEDGYHYDKPKIQMDLPPKNEYLPPEENNWEQFKKRFNKRYADLKEDDDRHAIFDDNVKFIDECNSNFASGVTKFECGTNKYSDLTSEEFIATRGGLGFKNRPPKRLYDAPYGSSISADSGGSGNDLLAPFGEARSGTGADGGFEDFDSNGQSGGDSEILKSSPENAKDLKEEVDWRKEGAITPVKDQGKCSSCWAFAANGALEAHNFIKKKTGPIPLSEQNMLDCVTDNDGCDGGFMTNAYAYAARNRGIDKESTYPYEGKQKQCRFDPANVGGECKSHIVIQPGDENGLAKAVANAGPVSVGIDFTQRSFQFYKSGYYFEPKCIQDVSHAVLIVGYGKTDDGEEYWICKNSWDTDWGEEGYIKMAKNKNNHCGITNLASYPVV